MVAILSRAYARHVELKATKYSIEDGVATITLARPRRHNAWTGRMHTEYRWSLQQAEDDPGVSVVVITGEGDAFCVGGDSQALDGHSARGSYDAGTPDDLATPGYGVDADFDADFAFQFGLTKPVIAAMNGSAAGVGLAVVLFADLRFAARGSKISTAHGRLGLPAEYGMAWILPRLIGITRANDLLLSSRKVVVDDIAGWGLFNDIVDGAELMSTVRSYAAMLVETVSPASLAATKRQIWSDQHRGAAAAVNDSNNRLTNMMAEPDYREGVAALLEKRPPNFGK